ncbi:hypothetical protein DPSP01_005112 [Paraphaeosphaeria sporulosa]
MNLFGEIVREGLQLFTKSADLQLQNGDHILVEFGREKTQVYIFYQKIPVTAKLLIDLNKLPPLKRQIALPTVAKFMWDKYLDWMENDYDIVKAASTYTWGQIFLLAHTTKILQDDRRHSMSLCALLEKGESVSYQIEGMFTMGDWQLVRNTVKAGEAQDDHTRAAIRRLFHECPLLFDHMINEHGAASQELLEIGLVYADTYDAKYFLNEDGLEQLDPVSIYGRPPRLAITDPSSIVESTAEIPQISGINGLGITQSGNGANEAVDVSGSELRDIEDNDENDGWGFASISSLGSSNSDTDEENSMDNEPTTAIVHSQPAEVLADQLADLAVQEVTAVENTERHTVSQVMDSFSDEGGVALQEVPVHSQSDDAVVCPSGEDIASDEDDVTLHQEDSPVNQEAGGNSVGSPEVTDVPQQTASSQGPSAKAVMMAAFTTIPGLQASMWALDMHQKFPVPLDADKEAALADCVNGSINSEQGDNGYVEADEEDDVIGSVDTQSEKETVSMPEEQQQLSYDLRSPIDLPQAASEVQPDAEDAEEPQNAEESGEASDVENVLGVEDAPGADNVQEAEDGSGAENAQDAEDVSGAEDQKEKENAERGPNIEYIAGFVPMHNLPRTAPGTPAEDEMGTTKNEEPSYEERRKNAGGRLLGKKRHNHAGGDVWDREAKRHEHKFTYQPRRVIKVPTKKYGNSALHAMRAKQAASIMAPKETAQREEPTRQPKGPPASGKEMADEKAKDPKAWPNNFAVGAPSRLRERPKEGIAFSSEKGIHSAVRDDGEGKD